jgi:hypothetical protein
MKKWRWIGVAGALPLVGRMTQVDREALSFPDLPNMLIYRPANSVYVCG